MTLYMTMQGNPGGGSSLVPANRPGRPLNGCAPSDRCQEGRENNLLVVELKCNAAHDECDHKKLELLTNPNGEYAYQFGLYIYINGGNFICTWYKDGCEVR